MAGKERNKSIRIFAGPPYHKHFKSETHVFKSVRKDADPFFSPLEGLLRIERIKEDKRGA